MDFGTGTEPQAAHQIMDSALDVGVNFFDADSVYGRAVWIGLTEEVVGDLAEPGRPAEAGGPGHQGLRPRLRPAQ